MIITCVLYTSGSKMLLWLERAWAGALRAAALRRVKSVDVYKMSARIVFVRQRRGARGRQTSTRL